MAHCCQVNGHGLVGVTHHEAVDVLKEAGNDVTVVVARLTTKPKPRPLSNQRPSRTTSRIRGRQASSSVANDALHPQPASDNVESFHQRPASSSLQPATPSANQSLSPEPASPARLSGAASPQYEVCDTY